MVEKLRLDVKTDIELDSMNEGVNVVIDVANVISVWPFLLDPPLTHRFHQLGTNRKRSKRPTNKILRTFIC